MGDLSFAVENILINICSLNCECLTNGCRGNPRIRDRKGYVFKIQLYVFKWILEISRLMFEMIYSTYSFTHSFIQTCRLPPICQPLRAQWVVGRLPLRTHVLIDKHPGCSTCIDSLIELSIPQQPHMCHISIFKSSEMCQGRRDLFQLFLENLGLYGIAFNRYVHWVGHSGKC